MNTVEELRAETKRLREIMWTVATAINRGEITKGRAAHLLACGAWKNYEHPPPPVDMLAPTKEPAPVPLKRSDLVGLTDPQKLRAMCRAAGEQINHAAQTTTSWRTVLQVAKDLRRAGDEWDVQEA